MGFVAPDLDGGSGGDDSSGGGNPGTPTGSSVGAAFPATENGGVIGTTYLLFVPVQSVSSGLCFIGIYDIESFDDTNDGSFYTYRAEDIVKDAVPTVNRVWITYRDIGKAKLTVMLSGSNDDGTVVSVSKVVQIGNAVPTNVLLTKQVDIQLSAFRPQLSFRREASGGPVCITAATMEGECGDA